MSSDSQPAILICAQPAEGHVGPLAVIAQDLVSRGYDVTFLTGSAYREAVEAVGATFAPLPGRSNWTARTLIFSLTPWALFWMSRPSGLTQTVAVYNYIFADMVQSQYEGIQHVLKAKLQKPESKVVILNDFTFWGVLPLLLEAPGIRPAGVISLGIQPLHLSSPEVPPLFSGLPYESSPESMERNKEAIKTLHQKTFAGTQTRFERALSKVGASSPPCHILDAQVLLPDHFLQIGIPSADYPRGEFPPSFQFIGTLPQGIRASSSTDTDRLPPWWDSFSSTKKQTIIVSQGTREDINFSRLVIPTLKAFGNDETIQVLAILGRRGKYLPRSFSAPKNAYVVDYLAYDTAFPHAKVFVTTGGYGGVQHALSHALPLVVAGCAEDKAENAARVQWCGNGIDLSTERPESHAIRSAVLQVLSDPNYLRRAEELQAETREYDSLGLVVKCIEELVPANSANGEPFVRAYNPETDDSAVAKICQQTMNPFFQQEPALTIGPFIWALPYLRICPDFCFVVDPGTGGPPVGYINGCPDNKGFITKYHSDYIPEVVRSGPAAVSHPPDLGAGLSAEAAVRDPGQALLGVLYMPEVVLNNDDIPQLEEKWPGHLHINVLPEWQGKGHGRALVEKFCQKVKDAGSRGVYLDAAIENEGAQQFYRKLGFTKFIIPEGTVSNPATAERRARTVQMTRTLIE